MIKVNNCLDCPFKELAKDASCDYICSIDPKKRLVFHYEFSVGEVTVTFEEEKKFCRIKNNHIIVIKESDNKLK